MIPKSFRLIIFLLLPFVYCKAGDELIPAGSYLINTGSEPQTVAAGLKPYGLVYELLAQHRVPIKWVINPTKLKDEADFFHNGMTFRSGSFIILSAYRTQEIDDVIRAWEQSGVIGTASTADLTLPVYATLTYAPRWTINNELAPDLGGAQVATLVIPFFFNAGIPASAYGGNEVSYWKTPSQLTSCDDIFVLPHSDPTWDKHNNLIAWNKDFKGSIWAGCHAVSVLENTTNLAGTAQMNFLTTNGLIHYNQHGNIEPPYTYRQPQDPISQFIKNFDLAANNGSESVYLPKLGSAWRDNVKILVEAAPIPDPLNQFTRGPAAILAYGRGFGDPDRGNVMYQAGHFHNGYSEIPEQPHISLQRAFFNFSFLSVIDKQKTFSGTINGEPEYAPGEEYSFTLTSNEDLSRYQVRWIASSGTISQDNGTEGAKFRAPADTNIDKVLLTAIFKDECEREFFITHTLSRICSQPKRGLNLQILGDTLMISGSSYNVQSTASQSLSSFRHKWSASSGQILPNDSAGQIQFIPDLDNAIKNVRLNLTVIDSCGWSYDTVHTIKVNHCKPDKTDNFSIISPDSLVIGFKNILNVTGIRDMDKFTYEWSASVGKFLPSSNIKNPALSLNLNEMAESVRLILRITDTCGFAYDTVKVIPIDLSKGMIKVPKLISANGDGVGYDYLFIRNIERFSDNQLYIYNRWGGEVYEAKNYDNKTNPFSGLSKTGEKLPEGVYYYVLKLIGSSGSGGADVPQAPEVVKGYFILQR